MYTHYWSTEVCGSGDWEGMQQAVPIIRKIVKRHRKLLCCEFDQPRKAPEVTPKRILFNGRGNDGHEDFLFQVYGRREFCKTSRKPYDLAVCETLLALNAHLPSMTLHSDGFSYSLEEQKNGVRFDGSWNQAIENVKRYGVHYRGRIRKRRAPYCDLVLVLDRVDTPASADA